MSILLSLLLLQATPDMAAGTPPYAVPGEDAVDPYTADNRNAGATPFEGDGMARAFHGQDGIRRIVDEMIEGSFKDPVIGQIFTSHDEVRLKRTIFEQFCYILNAGCSYSGRDMASSHKDLGVQKADMNRLVEVLQTAMTSEGVDFQAQNRFLSKLAPMRRDVLQK
jgi:hemoglobin